MSTITAPRMMSSDAMRGRDEALAGAASRAGSKASSGDRSARGAAVGIGGSPGCCVPTLMAIRPYARQRAVSKRRSWDGEWRDWRRQWYAGVASADTPPQERGNVLAPAAAHRDTRAVA